MPERARDLCSCCVTTNSPSGKRCAVGRSMIPGSPKLPAATRCASLAAVWGKNKDAEIIKSDTEIIILLLIKICIEANQARFQIIILKIF